MLKWMQGMLRYYRKEYAKLPSPIARISPVPPVVPDAFPPAKLPSPLASIFAGFFWSKE